MLQSTSHIMMVRPAHFGFNPETFESNPFQNKIDEPKSIIEQQAIREFDDMVQKLRDHDINVYVVQDSDQPKKTDAVFPNNWISFHTDGSIYLYPMFAEIRRKEKDLDVISTLQQYFEINRVIDLSGHEVENRFLEGTGSMVMDRVNRIAYACASIRTDIDLFVEHCEQMRYQPVFFHAYDPHGIPIYHTNVLMYIGSKCAAICLESIMGEAEQNIVKQHLEQSGHEVVALSFEQIASFAGNLLEVQSNDGKMFLVLSRSAYDILNKEQLSVFNKYYELLPMDIPTIETAGGGSVRCMMAEVFLPEKSES